MMLGIGMPQHSELLSIDSNHSNEMSPRYEWHKTNKINQLEEKRIDKPHKTITKIVFIRIQAMSLPFFSFIYTEWMWGTMIVKCTW